MLTAARSLRRAAAADPLPPVPALWRLTTDGVCPRRGELVMIVGIPNSGKSAFILWWTAVLNLPTLYFSADNNAHTSVTRLLSLITQTERRAIVEDLDDEDFGTQVEAEYAKTLADSQIQFCFDGSITMRDMTDELAAYVEVHDRWPEIIVVDNLINCEGTVDHQGQNGILSELHYAARLTGATVFVLHHASEANGQKPGSAPPRSQVQNKVTQYPDMVLGVAGDSTTGEFNVSVLKNRSDKSDPEAKRPYALYADFARCTFHADNPEPYKNWSPSANWSDDDD